MCNSYYACVMETIDGVPVTEEMIQAWADEAERGYDVDTLRRRGRKPKGDGPARVVPVRLDETLLGALDERLDEKGYIVPGLGDAGDRLYGTV